MADNTWGMPEDNMMIYEHVLGDAKIQHRRPDLMFAYQHKEVNTSGKHRFKNSSPNLDMRDIRSVGQCNCRGNMAGGDEIYRVRDGVANEQAAKCGERQVHDCGSHGHNPGVHTEDLARNPTQSTNILSDLTNHSSN